MKILKFVFLADSFKNKFIFKFGNSLLFIQNIFFNLLANPNEKNYYYRIFI